MEGVPATTRRGPERGSSALLCRSAPLVGNVGESPRFLEGGRRAGHTTRPRCPGTRSTRVTGASIAIATDAAEGRPPRVAESALVATLVNPRDGLFDRLLNRPISQAITPRLLRLPVTPNQVTLLSLAVGGRAT